MVVCAHGNVSDFCEKHGIKIFEKYTGDLKDYSGSCAVVVTDQKMTREQYESLKCTMFGRGVELVSVDWTDDAIILALLRQTLENRRHKGGRQMFGFTKKNGVVVEIPAKIAVAKRIIALRDAGLSYQKISEDPAVRHCGGKKLARSTIHTIVENREIYERK